MEGWGALLALDLRGAPSSRAGRPPSSPDAQGPPHHHLTQLLRILLASPVGSWALPLRGPCALGLAQSWICYVLLNVKSLSIFPLA